MLSSKKGPAGAGLAVQPPERGRKMGEKMAKRSRWLRPWRAKRHFCKPCAHRRQRVCGREVDMREPEWRTRSHLMAMRVCTSEDCPCSSHNLRYLLYIGEFVLYTRDLVSGTEAEERGRKVEKVLSHGGIRLEPKVIFSAITSNYIGLLQILHAQTRWHATSENNSQDFGPGPNMIFFECKI